MHEGTSLLDPHAGMPSALESSEPVVQPPTVTADHHVRAVILDMVTDSFFGAAAHTKRYAFDLAWLLLRGLSAPEQVGEARAFLGRGDYSQLLGFLHRNYPAVLQAHLGRGVADSSRSL